VTPYLVDDWQQLVLRGLEGEQINGKCVFGTNRLADAVSANRPVVDAACNPVEIWSRLSEMLLKERYRLRFEMEPVSIPSRFIFAVVAGPTP
jgi:hypothetical protein